MVNIKEIKEYMLHHLEIDDITLKKFEKKLSLIEKIDVNFDKLDWYWSSNGNKYVYVIFENKNKILRLRFYSKQITIYFMRKYQNIVEFSGALKGTNKQLQYNIDKFNGE